MKNKCHLILLKSASFQSLEPTNAESCEKLYCIKEKVKNIKSYLKKIKENDSMKNEIKN